jgi:hypothetical protein
MRQVIFRGPSNQVIHITFSSITSHPQYEKPVAEYIDNIVKYTIQPNYLEEVKVNHIYTAPAGICGNELFINFYSIAVILKKGMLYDPSEKFETLASFTRNRDLFQYGLQDDNNVHLYGTTMMGEFTGAFNTIMVNPRLEHRSMYKEWYYAFGREATIKPSTPVVCLSTNKEGAKLKYRNMDDYYNRTKYDCEITIYDNAAEAINSVPYAMQIQTISPASATLTRNMYMDTSIKLSAEYVRNSLIIKDNNTGYNSIKNKIIEGDLTGAYHVIEVNQYSALKRMTYFYNKTSVDSGCYINQLCLCLIPKQTIAGYRQVRMGSTSTILEASVICRTKERMSEVRLYCAPSNPTRASLYIVPFVPEEDLHLRTMDHINSMYSLDHPNIRASLETYANHYLLSNNDTDEGEDVLTKWFNMSTGNASKDEEKLKVAYTTLKEGLLKEYKEVELFLAHNALGNKQPIPALQLDPELARGVEHKLAFEQVTRSLSGVGYHRLTKPIKYQELELKSMIKVKQGKHVVIHTSSTPWKKIYDKNNNTIVITMKGVKN